MSKSVKYKSKYMKKHTKIVATISDRKCDPKFLRELYEAGMDVVRINTAHQTPEDTLKVVKNVRAVSERLSILIDTKGPEVRTTKAPKKLVYKQGDTLKIQANPNADSTQEVVNVNFDGFVKEVPVGSSILIDDGVISLAVIDKTPNELICRVENDGEIGSRKSINVPNVYFSLPTLSKKDLEYINFAIEHEVDFIAHSFVRSKEDVIAIRGLLDAHKSSIKIIAKIENQQGVDNIDEILDYAYGVMVARGDLGIEVPAEKIPGIQKKLVQKCTDRRRPVIVATQMLHSMIKSPRPTRAEVNDVANAIYDGTDAIMLSGETAYGEYPIEAVKTMTRIAREVEANKSVFLDIAKFTEHSPISAYLAKSAVKASVRLDAKAILADSMSGRTIRDLAAYRGQKPIFAMCYDKKTMRELSLSYGVDPAFMEPRDITEEFLTIAFDRLMKLPFLSKSDTFVVLAGNFGMGSGASFIEVSSAENILARAKKEK